MDLINQITSKIIENAENGETIRSLAEKTGFAYSAVYKWVLELEKYEVINLVRKGNKNIIRINNNDIHKKFIELGAVINVVKKDKAFWSIIKNTKLRLGFAKSTAIVIWTQGGYITGDFLDKVYFLEVYHKDLNSFKKVLEKNNISYSKNYIINKRPLICITSNSKKFKVERKEGLPVIQLKELVKWCKKLYLNNVLEQLDSIYNLKLKAKYSEINTNI